MHVIKQFGILAAAIGMMIIAKPASAQKIPADASNFYKNENIVVQKVTFQNLYKTKVSGNLFTSKDLNTDAQYPAIVVGHPMGAIKEQSANLYAIKMAEQGFVTLSLDLSFWGESKGEACNAVLPDLYSEDFNAAVDFLGSTSFVDRERIGIIGICGSGSFALSAAKIDPHIKAVATINMYDMGAANRNGLYHSLTLEQREKVLKKAAEQRYVEFNDGKTERTERIIWS